MEITSAINKHFLEFDESISLSQMIGKLKESDKKSGLIFQKGKYKGIFDNIFHNFEIKTVSQINPLDIINEHWDKIKVIRFKRKVKSIIDCAKSFELIHDKYGSFKTLLSDIPKGLKSKTDVESF